MARGKGRKNESRGKARVNRQLGKGPASGRTGGGAAEANPELDRVRQQARQREAEPIQKRVHRRGASRTSK